VKVGFVIQNQGAEALEQVSSLGPLVEELGYDSVWLTDHVIGVRSFERHGYTNYWLECLTGLSYIAAQTSRVRIGTSVLVAPVRNPVYVAKVLSTLDNLSHGRLTVAIGTGWSRGEFEALGHAADHEPRGAVTNEMLEVMLRCWQGGQFEWHGERFDFGAITFEPTPLQQPRLPILIGGPAAPAIARRVARFGDGWHPAGTDVAALAEEIGRMKQLLQREVPIHYRLILPPETGEGQLAEQLGRLRDLGCAETILDFRPTGCATAAAAAERAIRIHRSV
jgi:probable F420-dependent oxidoreductase